MSKQSEIFLAEYITELRYEGRLTRFMSTDEVHKCMIEDIQSINAKVGNKLIINENEHPNKTS